MSRVPKRPASSRIILEEQPEAIDALTSDDGDHVSVQSTEEDYCDSDDDSSESAVKMDVDEDDNLDNLNLQQRLQDARRNCNGLASVSNTKKSTSRFTDRPAGCSSHPPPIIIRVPDGPDGPASNFVKLEQFYQALMPDFIFSKIVFHTNNQIEHVCATMMAKDQTTQSYHHLTDIDEIKALVGLIYYAGSRRDTRVDTHNMWDKKHGITVYRCTMPVMRFTFLCSCLRFDDKKSRDGSDKLAPVREIWTNFMNNCRKCCNIGGKTTVGQLLLGFKGRCPFRVRRKFKFGNKYGIQLITLNDARTGYLLNAIPYLGKNCVEGKIASETNSEYFFRKVTEPIHGSGRTVTCDSWFTSIPLIDRFVEQPYKLTITGAIRKGKAEIPAYMKVASKKVPNTRFCGTDNVTLVSHTTKKKKMVLVASSYSKSTGFMNEKPDILLHYDETKGGTDMFDQLCQAYTVAMRTNRWSMRFFLGILDQAATNAGILYKWSRENVNKDVSRIKTCECIQDIALHLIRPYLRSRIAVFTLRTDLRVGIQAILNVSETITTNEERPCLETKVKCEIGARKCGTKTRKQCPSCRRTMCDEHRVYLCVDCGCPD